LSDDNWSATDDEDMLNTTIFWHFSLKLGKVKREKRANKGCGKCGRRD
jgi:hypothetical protein